MIDPAGDLDLFLADFGVPVVRERDGCLDSEPFMAIVGTNDDESHQGYLQSAVMQVRFMAGHCDVRPGDRLRLYVLVEAEGVASEADEAYRRLTGAAPASPSPVVEPGAYPVLKVEKKVDGLEVLAWLGDL